MATMMSNQAPSTGQPADQPMDDQGGADASAGYEICIKVSADGSISVSQEPLDMAQEQSEGPEDEAAQQVGSIGEALKAALQIYQQSGAPTGQDQLQAGYDQSGPSPMQSPQAGQ